MRLKTTYGPGKPTIWHALELPDDERTRVHGRATFQVEDEIVSGEFTSIRFEFVIGEQEIPTGGRLAVIWRWPFDWSALQTEDPKGDGFCRIQAVSVGDQSSVIFETNYLPYGGIEPYHHVLDLKITQGLLKQGDRVSVVAGDQSEGSRGWRAPTCAVRESYFLMCVDPTGGKQWTELIRQSPFAIKPGVAQRAVTIVPTDVVAGEPFRVIVRAEDQWGNATHASQPPLVTLSEATCSESTTIAHPAAYHFTMRIDQEGTLRVTSMIPSENILSESNPFRVHKSKPKKQIFWGDLHSGQTLIGCGAGTLAEHYAFGRDAAGLTFITHQANDHYVTVADWQETRDVTKQFHEPGNYITILGCEWSAMTPAGGDRNVYYRNDEPRMRRSDRFFEESEPDPEPDIPTATEFHKAFRDEDVLVNIHVGGRMTNLDWYEPKVERLAEVHSTHGTVQWFVEDCLRRGYPVAVTAGTDGVMGRPGACHPGSRLIRNVRNGLTAVFAEELTIEALWKAFKQRRTYGTTGERIILDVSVNGHPMGTEFETTQTPQIRIFAEGTAPIECVDLMLGTDIIHTWQVAAFSEHSECRWRVLWSGTQERGTARRQRVVWDGSLGFEGARIVNVERIGFQSPLDQIQQSSDNKISWKSITAGNDAGVIVTLDTDTWSGGNFESEPSSFRFHQQQAAEHLRVSAGGVARQVRISPAPKSDGLLRVDLRYDDFECVKGWCPYWVRVTQTDQAKAWSSPVYVIRT